MNLMNRKEKAEAPFYSNGTSRCDSALSNNSDNSLSSTENSFGPDKSIVDLDEIVERWVMYMWEKTKNKKQDFEDVQVIINWEKVELDQDDVKFDKQRSVHNKEPVSQTLFSTYFTNKTDQVQEYSFKTERKTRQSCTFSFEKTFTREKECGLSIKLPQDIIEIGGGLRCIQTIGCGKDKTNEEEVSWGVDSLIKVKPKSRVCASLDITEVKLERSFSISTYLRGRLLATIVNKRDSNAILKTFSAEITEIVKLALERNWIPKDACKFEVLELNYSKLVKITLNGKCKFRIGIEQHINLDEIDLDQIKLRDELEKKLKL